MKAVGVKMLKARLSEYLRLVKAGEIVLVMDRDEVVAELRPANRQRAAPSTLEEGLELMAASGQATLRSEEMHNWTGPAKSFRLKGISSKALLDKLRKDSR
jgi:antitoxin (DNA-binding transcriptional repressor) of toxin-antitoxin stability system